MVVKYGWSRTMFIMEDLFRKQLHLHQINIHHPKVSCMKNALEKVRLRTNDRPAAVIKVPLPIKVQTVTDTWIKGGLERDDGNMKI